MHPHIRKGLYAVMLVSGGIFAFLTMLTIAGVVLILANGGSV